MLQLPMPAATTKASGGAANYGRLLLQAALDASSKHKREGSQTTPTSPASPASPDGTEDSEGKHAFGWFLIRSALSGIRSPKGENGKDAKDGGLDLLESMEEGHAHEITTDFVVPLRRSSKLWRFRVHRSEDNLSFRLLTEAGDFLIFASIRLEVQRVDFHMYDPIQKEFLGFCLR